MCVLFITRMLRLVGRLNQFNHNSGMAVVTPTDRRKSVRKRCVIEVLVALFARGFWGFFYVGVAFILGLSHISSFFSL